MKKKILITVALLFITIATYKIISVPKINNQEEMETLDGKVALYFKNIETNELEKEYRNISMKRIIENMPKAIVEEVLNGPQIDSHETTVPERNKTFKHRY